MCICFYTLLHPRYALVLASNRDEFLARPTLAADWYWPHGSREGDNDKFILSGRDVTGGGTWLGIERRTGKFGILTNVREEVTVTARSRGRLVSDWLETDASIDANTYIDSVRSGMQEYAGFNLLVGRVRAGRGGQGSSLGRGDTEGNEVQVQMCFVSNRGDHIRHSVMPNAESVESSTNTLSNRQSDGCVRDLEDAQGFAVMSNGALACGLGATAAHDLDRAWPKMESGRTTFQASLDRHTRESDETSEGLVKDLLDSVLSVARPEIRDKEEVRSSVLVTPFDMFPGSGSWYATRAQTVILVERGTGKITFVERQAYHMLAGQPQWDGSVSQWDFLPDT